MPGPLASRVLLLLLLCGGVSWAALLDQHTYYRLGATPRDVTLGASGAEVFLSTYSGLAVLTVDASGLHIASQMAGQYEASVLAQADGVLYAAQPHKVDAVRISGTSKPQVLGSATIPTSRTSEASRCARLDQHHDALYLGCHYDGLAIVDVSSPTAPRYVRHLYIDSTRETKGVRVDTLRNRLFVCTGDASGGVSLFDVSKPLDPVLLGFQETQSACYDLRLEDAVLYVADGADLEVYNTSGDVFVALSTCCATPSADLNLVGLALHGSYVFASDYFKRLLVVDVADPRRAVSVQYFDAPWGGKEGIVVQQAGGVLRVWQCMTDGVGLYWGDVVTAAPTGVPSTAVPTVVPATLAPMTAVPLTPAPATNVPRTDAPETKPPVTSVPATPAPSTKVPLTDVPETKAPATGVPTAVPTEVPATLVPATLAPVTASPATAVPSTDAPETEPPVTVVPATSAPLTPVPLTDAPVTATPATPVPQTGVPSTPSPVTGVPATPAPQTNTPTHAPATPLSPTLAPGTRAPETPAPGPTAAPPLVATAAPLTPAPTATQPPDTEAPVTQVPHTPAPIAAPTPAPATDVPHTRAPATDVMPTPAPDAASSTGLVVGLSLAGLCVCAAAGAVLCRRRMRPQQEEDPKEMTMLSHEACVTLDVYGASSPSRSTAYLDAPASTGTSAFPSSLGTYQALGVAETLVTCMHPTGRGLCVVPQGPQVEGPVDEVYASWRWENHVGSGAYGEVHVGRVSTGRQVALKERVRATCGEAAEARAMLALMQRLQHPHIVEVLDMVYDPQQARLCVLMEYVAGTTLGAYARSLPHRMAEETAAHYVGQVLLALEFLHSHQVVHRDLKGDNVIVTGDGVAKLCDFGTVKDLAAGGGASAWGSSDGVTDSRLLNTQVGSPNFMAPEVLQSGVHVARAGTPADVYALGCMASEVLNCGVPPGPQAGNVWAAVMAAPQWPPANLVEGVSAEAGDFVAACTRQSPDDRATASQLLRHAFVTGAAGHTAPAVPPAAVWLTEEEMLAGERVRPALGMGAFGVVHRVRVPGGGGAVPVREVAVKEMFLGASHTAKVRQRAEQEFQLMRSLRHPHIVQYLGHRWPDASTLEIYMECMPGGSVKAAVRAAQTQSQPQPHTRGLPIDTVKAYTRQVLLGLAYLHTGEAGRAPVAHRDLKADNLLLAGDGTVKIADFGCSKLFGVDAESERDGVTYGADGAKTCVGTPFWMAPEVLQQRHDASGAYGTRCDIWSLGCTVVEMLGTVPWRTATAEPAHQTVQRILESTDGPPLPADTPHDTAAFVRRCCVRDPAARPPATALLHDLMVLGADPSAPCPLEPLL